MFARKPEQLYVLNAWGTHQERVRIVPNLAAYGKLSSTKLMPDHFTATRISNMETNLVTSVAIHQLNLLSIFVVAKFKDKAFLSRFLSDNKAKHYNTPQTWWSFD